LGADRLLDPATTGMLLAIRRGFIEETNAASTGEFVLIDMAVIAFANAMRVQSMIGNTSLILEAEMFGQPTLRAKWEKEYGGRRRTSRDWQSRSMCNGFGIGLCRWQSTFSGWREKPSRHSGGSDKFLPRTSSGLCLSKSILRRRTDRGVAPAIVETPS
jgi:hypothetical protein